MSIANTLREIANESALNKAEKTSLRLIAKRVDILQAKNEKQAKLIKSLIQKVPEREMTTEDVKNIIDFLGLDIDPAWAKVKQAISEAEKIK